MKWISRFFIFAFILTINSSFALFWKKHKAYSYTIQYPKSWTLDESGKLGTTCIFSAGLDSDKDDFAENVNLTTQDVSELGLSLNKFIEITLQQVKTMLPNGKLLLNERVRGRGQEFQRLIYTSTMNKRKLKFEQYCWVKEQKAYVLTFCAEEVEYDKYRKVGQKILNSFVFNKKAF